MAKTTKQTLTWHQVRSKKDLPEVGKRVLLKIKASYGHQKESYDYGYLIGIGITDAARKRLKPCERKRTIPHTDKYSADDIFAMWKARLETRISGDWTVILEKYVAFGDDFRFGEVDNCTMTSGWMASTATSSRGRTLPASSTSPSSMRNPESRPYGSPGRHAGRDARLSSWT